MQRLECIVTILRSNVLASEYIHQNFRQNIISTLVHLIYCHQLTIWLGTDFGDSLPSYPGTSLYMMHSSQCNFTRCDMHVAIQTTPSSLNELGCNTLQYSCYEGFHMIRVPQWPRIVQGHRTKATHNWAPPKATKKTSAPQKTNTQEQPTKATHRGNQGQRTGATHRGNAQGNAQG